MATPVFWLEPSAFVEISLRRFVSTKYSESGTRIPGGECPLMPGEYSYHTNSVVIEQRLPLWQTDDDKEISGDNWSHDDSRWPIHCACGYQFVDTDNWQKNAHSLFRSSLDGALYTLVNAPVGAMWDAHWMGAWWKGPDGICLVVKLPNGHDWMPDSEASNCTDPAKNHPVGEGDDRHHARTHYCWTRKGDPKTGVIDVSKDYGPTCAAGAGSILSGSYHGFLRHGFLTD